MNTVIVLSAFGGKLLSEPIVVPGRPGAYYMPHYEPEAVQWPQPCTDSGLTIKQACFEHTGRQTTTRDGVVAWMYELVSTE